eukprot:1288657-Pleurochrysis_carterae.AAC.1
MARARASVTVSVSPPYHCHSPCIYFLASRPPISISLLASRSFRLVFPTLSRHHRLSPLARPCASSLRSQPPIQFTRRRLELGRQPSEHRIVSLRCVQRSGRCDAAEAREKRKGLKRGKEGEGEAKGS